MPHPQFDRSRVRHKPLAERANRVSIEGDSVQPDDQPAEMPEDELRRIDETAKRIKHARDEDRPVILAFGAHAIKNGLGPVLVHLMENGWLTHLATNGASIIHDWELAYQGETSEDVRENVAVGEFGNWRETGYYINLALAVGAYRGLGYGESVGKMIAEQGLEIPSRQELIRSMRDSLETQTTSGKLGAAADLLETVDRLSLQPGPIEIKHPHLEFSPQAAAYRLGLPFTGHPMIGHDIIYNHEANHGGAVGRTALRDFRAFADSVSRLQGGVYLSVGSAVMSPMIFEKSLSMARNVALQEARRIDDFFITVVDLAESTWDWSKGEPPEEHPDYYLRFYKTFHRMGGTLQYVHGDNRDFFLYLCRKLDT